MRIIHTENKAQVAIIAATKAELAKLKRLKNTAPFNPYITTEPYKSETYNCFVMVYTFADSQHARLYRLAYAVANKRGAITSIRRAYGHKLKRPPSYYAKRKAATNRRRLRRQRKRTKTRYLKLIPLLKAGNIETIEAKAREIARINVIADLL